MNNISQPYEQQNICSINGLHNITTSVLRAHKLLLISLLRCDYACVYGKRLFKVVRLFMYMNSKEKKYEQPRTTSHNLLRKKGDESMGAMQRNKGASGERELAKALYEMLGVELKRNLTQPRDGGVDLKVVDLKEKMPSVLDPWAIESKRAKKPLINAWWKQACEQAEKAGKLPVLFYRLDRQQWRCVLALRDVSTSFSNAPLSLLVETDLEVFAAIAREVHHAA